MLVSFSFLYKYMELTLLVLLQNQSLLFMSGYKLQMPCLGGDYKFPTLNFNWVQIKKKVWGYFLQWFGDLYRVLTTCLSWQAERQLLKWIFMLWLQNTKPCAAWCLFCKSLSHSNYCLRKEGGKQLVAVSSISPSFSILCLKRYTQTCTRSAFRGIQCMVISTQAALNFLKLRTLILC